MISFNSYRYLLEEQNSYISVITCLLFKGIQSFPHSCAFSPDKFKTEISLTIYVLQIRISLLWAAFRHTDNEGFFSSSVS